MSLNRPFLPADRTPLVLHIERLRSVPPARRRWHEALDTVAIGAVWLLLVGCMLVMVAGVMVMVAAWLDNGGAR